MSTKVIERGQILLRDPLLNKGTAFSSAEKEAFQLYGLLPSNTETIEEQLLRCNDAYAAKTTPLEQHIYLRALQDRNEVLFYRFVLEHLVDIMPVIYTPVVGEACQLFHHIYRQNGEGRLLPELSTIRQVSQHIANAFILQGIKEGHIAKMNKEQVEKAVQKTMWVPQYESYEAT